MCVHTKCNGFITVAELFGYACHISAICDGDAGEGVPQLVRMQIRYAALRGELLHIAGRRLRMHGFGTVRLREYKRTDRLPRLFQPEFTEQTDDLRVDVDRPHLSAFRSIQVDTLFAGYSTGCR